MRCSKAGLRQFNLPFSHWLALYVDTFSLVPYCLVYIELLAAAGRSWSDMEGCCLLCLVVTYFHSSYPALFVLHSWLPAVAGRFWSDMEGRCLLCDAVTLGSATNDLQRLKRLLGLTVTAFSESHSKLCVSCDSKLGAVEMMLDELRTLYIESRRTYSLLVDVAEEKQQQKCQV